MLIDSLFNLLAAFNFTVKKRKIADYVIQKAIKLARGDYKQKLVFVPRINILINKI